MWGPWIVAYFGGKDSTLLLQLVWEAAAAVGTERRRPIYVVSNDTLVESPLVIGHLRRSLDVIRAAARAAGLPIAVKITEPCIDQTFWVNVIGRGTSPPTRNFRWCTDRMKILPTNRLIERLILTHGRAVLLIGTRRSESQHRGHAMNRRGVTATEMNPHGAIEPRQRAAGDRRAGRTAGAGADSRRPRLLGAEGARRPGCSPGASLAGTT